MEVQVSARNERAAHFSSLSSVSLISLDLIKRIQASSAARILERLLRVLLRFALLVLALIRLVDILDFSIAIRLCDTLVLTSDCSGTLANLPPLRSGSTSSISVRWFEAFSWTCLPLPFSVSGMVSSRVCCLAALDGRPRFFALLGLVSSALRLVPADSLFDAGLELSF